MKRQAKERYDVEISKPVNEHRKVTIENINRRSAYKYIAMEDKRNSQQHLGEKDPEADSFGSDEDFDEEYMHGSKIPGMGVEGESDNGGALLDANS